MFFHGISYPHLLSQFPILSPRLTILKQNKLQKQDREHLIEQFGFEPVHMLESSKSYTEQQCINACLEFGNVVFGFKKLSAPLLQLSEHEIGVPVVDVRKADVIYVKDLKNISKVRKIFPKTTIFYVNNHNKIKISKKEPLKLRVIR